MFHSQAPVFTMPFKTSSTMLPPHIRSNSSFEDSDSDSDQHSLPDTPGTPGSVGSHCDKEAITAPRKSIIPEDLLDLSNVLKPVARCPSPFATAESLLPYAASKPVATAGKVLVCGVGYVGEELVTAFSSAYDTLAFDVNQSRCQFLEGHYKGNPNVTVTSNREDVAKTNFDVALISVPTLLLDDCRTIDTTHITKAVAFVSQHARPGSLVVIESSVTVGMTRQLLGHLRAKGVFVGFSPERVDPGRVSPHFEDIPKVISGIDAESLEQVRRYYSRVFTTVVPVPTLETAEFTKLYENCQRLMLVHYANELADACESHGVDVFEVCKASSTKPFGFTPFTPSLGAGGSCIPINPFYLLTNCDMPLLRHAAEANRERPLIKAREIAKRAEKVASEAVALATRQPGAPRVLIYGLGFKKGNSSLVCAPAATMAEELVKAGIEVAYFDVVARSDRWARIGSDELLSRDLDGRFDVIAVTHSPDVEHREAFAQLQHTQVAYFSR